MDPITGQVRTLYDRFPYPDESDQVRADAFLELLLSYVERPRREPPLYVLDAGCGTGSGIVPVAQLHPGAQCVGVDVSETALDRARTLVRAAGLGNLELVTGDIMDPDSLPRAPGRAGADAGAGYDVIYASGVVHHLADPVAGLRNLGALLADNGVLVLMVYGTHGRQPVFRFARAMDLLWPRREELDTRIPLARVLLESLGDSAVTAPPWDDGPFVPDNELVDRYLHVHDRGYTAGELFELIDQAGLTFLRWLEPRAFDAIQMMGRTRAGELIASLPERQRCEVLDLLYDHTSLTAVLGRKGARPRTPPDAAGLGDATVVWNPQAALRSTTRHMAGALLVSDVEVMVRLLAPYRLDGIHAALAQSLGQSARGREHGRDLVRTARGLVEADEDRAYGALAELLEREVCFIP